MKDMFEEKDVFPCHLMVYLQKQWSMNSRVL